LGRTTPSSTADFKTTQRYIELTNETFASEVAKLDARLWGDGGTNLGTNSAADTPSETAQMQ
jgi:hypothetical protein